MNNPNYAKQPTGRQAKSFGGTLIGVFIGLVLGILIALGVVLYLNKAALPFEDKYEGANKPTAPAANGQPTVPLELPGKPGSVVPEKQRLDFYGMLEGKPATNAQSAPAIPVAATPAATPVVPAAATDSLYLQLGSFQKPADAENLKAKLTITGFDALVQEVDIPNKGTMHRVRVGPFANMTDMEAARGRLTQAGIAGTVVKLKP